MLKWLLNCPSGPHCGTVCEAVEPPLYPAQKSNVCIAPKTGRKSDGGLGPISRPCANPILEAFPHPLTTGNKAVNVAFHSLEGVRMPPGPQDGHKRPHNAKQGLSWIWVASGPPLNPSEAGLIGRKSGFAPTTAGLWLSITAGLCSSRSIGPVPHADTCPLAEGFNCPSSSCS